MVLKFLIALGVSALSAFAADFFPLQTGNTWTYRNAKLSQEFTVRVGPPVLMNNRMYYSLSGYVTQPVLARIDDKGELVMLDTDAGVERILTSFIPFEGGFWNAPLRECPEQLGRTHERRGSHEGPAGTFRDVLEIEYRTIGCADVGVLSEQYSENIGMLRRVTTTIIGPRVFDLVRAKVGNVEINGDLNAKFTISAVPAPNGDLNVTLDLRTTAPQIFKLKFPSGQEFELVLRDSEGNSIWTYSAGRLFIQALHEREVALQYTLTATVPRAFLAIPEGKHDFVLQGWLTTVGDVPQFSASVPVKF